MTTGQIDPQPTDHTNGFTNEELQIARMSREYAGELVAIGSTLFAVLATKVAKLVHDDDLVVPGGNSWACFDAKVGPSTGYDEYLCRSGAIGQYDWSLVFDLISADKFRITIGPVQVDKSGAANISVVGDWAKPRVQLIGSRGLPDDVWRLSVMNFHVPNHNRRSLVEKVDFVSMFGNGLVRDDLGCTTGRPGTLVTNLGVFSWPNGGSMAIESIHPGVTAEEIRDNTGFDLDIPPDTPFTAPPTVDELHAIRDLVDPLGSRTGRPTDGNLGRTIAQSMSATAGR